MCGDMIIIQCVVISCSVVFIVLLDNWRYHITYKADASAVCILIDIQISNCHTKPEPQKINFRMS